MEFRRIGILSIGEMGFHWARLLAGHGVEVLTVLEGRSEVTRKRAENAGARSVPLSELVSGSDLIVSLVVPSAATRVAATVARAAARAGREGLVYLDANAISPMTALKIRGLLARSRAELIDGCIIGSAARLNLGAMVYVSGPGAERMERLGEFGLSVRLLGQEVGQASAFKIIYAGLTKGLQGLFVELLLGARKLGLLEEIMRRYEESFPGLIAKVSDSIAGLPVHAGRRAEEMAELARTYRYYGLKAVMAPATERLLKAIAALDAGRASEVGERKGDLLGALEIFLEKGLLQQIRREASVAPAPPADSTANRQ